MELAEKDRFLEICRFERPNDLYMWDCGFWTETLREWIKQGAPKEMMDQMLYLETEIVKRVVKDIKIDVVAVRKQYGKDLIIGGAIDKRALAKDKDAIREEVYSKVPFLMEAGGYIPTTDHAVPPDVSLENYQYYINTIRDVVGQDRISF